MQHPTLRHWASALVLLACGIGAFSVFSSCAGKHDSRYHVTLPQVVQAKWPLDCDLQQAGGSSIGRAHGVDVVSSNLPLNKYLAEGAARCVSAFDPVCLVLLHGCFVWHFKQLYLIIFDHCIQPCLNGAQQAGWTSEGLC
jgi:hypothetical protein